LAQKDVSILSEYFEDSETTSYDARVKAERDKDYYDGKQWTDKETAALNKRGQPVIVSNLIKPKIDALTGMERMNRTDPKALPRNPGDEEAAEAITKALRYVADNSNYDEKRSQFYEDMIVQGAGACEFSIKPHENGDREIVMTHVPWDRFFYDPASVKPDFSDSLYYGHVIWMDAERAKQKWPNLKDELTNIMEQSTADTYDDKPGLWIDSSRKRVRVVKMYYVSAGQWYVATFTKGVEIENIVSPFVDEMGVTYPALSAMSGFIDRDNNRYGVVRQMVSPQDEVNKRRSKLLHLLSVRQVRINPGKNIKAETIRQELAKPDGVIEARPDDLEILSTSDMSQGQVLLLQEAKMEIDAVGVNPTLQGKEPAALSGRAILAQQAAGAMELGTIADRKRFWDLTNYRTIYRLIRQYWNDQKWIRITNDEGAIDFVGLNQPLTVRDQIEENPAILEELVAQGIDPNSIDLDAVVGIKNSVGELDVDVIMEEAPDIATLKTETFEQLANSGILANLPIEVILDLMPNLSGDTKQSIEDKLSGGDDPEMQALMQQQQQQQQDLMTRAAEADIQVDEMTAMEKFANAEKTKAETATIIATAFDDEDGVTNQ